MAITNNKSSKRFFLAILVLAIIAIAGCTKAECKADSDCLQKGCTISRCQNEKCSFTPQQNCCGNGIKDEIENGKKGSACTCPQDYGRCEGMAKLKVGSRTEDAFYVKNYCNAQNECVFGVEAKDIMPQGFLDQINNGYFKASIVSKFNKPFDVNTDKFEFTITLDDLGKNTVLPVKFTKAKVLYSGPTSRTEMLVSEKELSAALNGITDKVTLIVPLTLGYRPKEVEETGSIRYSLDYEYIKQINSGKDANGSILFKNETSRDTFSGTTKPVAFIRSQ